MSIWEMLARRMIRAAGSGWYTAHGAAWLAKSREGFAVCSVVEDDLRQIVPCLSSEIRSLDEAPPHPSASHRAGEHNASLARVRDSTRNQSTLRADYGPELSAWIIVGAAVCAKNSVMRCLSAACGKIVHR